MDASNLPTIVEFRERNSETPIRLLVLGAIYAGAVFFAVAFSPAIGFVASAPHAQGGKLASAQQLPQ